MYIVQSIKALPPHQGLNFLQQASIPLSPQLSHWISELYSKARQKPVKEFKQWCFKSLQQLFPFDRGLWATRSDLKALRTEHMVDDISLYNQADNFMANYEKVTQNVNVPDPVNQYCAQHPGKFASIWQCCPKAQWHQSDYYLKHCHLFGIETGISAIIGSTDNSAVIHAISFFRAEPDDDFTDHEILLADFILPNLVESFRICVLSSFSKTQDKGESYRAVLDRFGELLEAEAGFYQLMQRQSLLENTRVNIPELNKIKASSQLSCAGLTFDITFNEGLLYIEASESSLLYKLTEREYQICELLTKGLNSKEIANYLSGSNLSGSNLSKNKANQQIKTNTVSSHLTNIYRKLKVKHKSAATAYFLKHVSR